MKKYLYDAVTNAFYPLAMREEWEAMGLWPESGIEVDEALFAAFQTPPAGKVRVASSDGRPSWADVPPKTSEQYVQEAELQKSALRKFADAEIAPLQDAVDIGDATEDELANLTAWKKYRIALNRLDLSTAPDIDWPEIPA